MRVILTLKTLMFRFSICHLPGKLNKVANAASRFPTSQPEEGDTLGQLDNLQPKPTEQEKEESLAIEQQILGRNEAAICGLYMEGVHSPAGSTRGQRDVAAQTESILSCESSPLLPGTCHSLQRESGGPSQPQTGGPRGPPQWQWRRDQHDLQGGGQCLVARDNR